MKKMWNAEKSSAASMQGWDVFDNDKYGLEIERIDDMSEVCPGGDGHPVFVSDDDAVSYVKHMAASGDDLCIYALSITE